MRNQFVIIIHAIYGSMYKKWSILTNKLMLQLTLTVTLGVKAGNMKKNFNTGSILGVGLGNER